MIGQRLGPYEITAKLGAGGMGEVYRATDSRLKREVAIKVLPAAFTADKERLARFEREAQLLAQLNHPNIAQVYGLETSGETHALVMELVPGPTLAERLETGPLSLTESLSFALQIAQALEEAHDKGIVHRDLKPQNVKASSEEKAKVLDFGLAKAMDAASGSTSAADLARSPTLMNSPTLTAVHGTQLGMILGTAAYMAPEQARGAAVDKRADIWALGVLLYEMLTGVRLFEGESVVDTLSAVMRQEIDLGRLPAGTPGAIRQLLRRCLERSPKNRLHDIADARIVLDEVLGGRSEELPPTATATRPAARTTGWTWGLAAGALFVGLGLGALVFRAAAPPGAATQGAALHAEFEIATPSGTTMVSGLALSSDGRQLAFVARGKDGRTALWVRPLGSTEPKELPGTVDARFPFWSPDGRRLGFFAQRRLKVIDLLGGSPRAIAETGSTQDARGGAWSADDRIVFAPTFTGTLFVVPASGGEAVPASRIPAGTDIGTQRFPSFLPDGERFLFFASTGTGIEPGTAYLGRLGSLEAKKLGQVTSSAFYAAPGYLIFVQGDALVAQRFDNAKEELVGDAISLGVSLPGSVSVSGQRSLAVSANGVLAYRADKRNGTRLVWVDRRGAELGQLNEDDRNWHYTPALSPDGGKVAVSYYEVGATSGGIWIHDLARRFSTRLTSGDAGDDTLPVWSPDGRELAFGRVGPAGTSGIYRMDAVRPGSESRWYAEDGFLAPSDWLTDGTGLLVQRFDASGKGSIWLQPLATQAPPTRLGSEQASEWGAVASHDGRWIAYSSDATGRMEVYVRRLGGSSTAPVRISLDGGASPAWRGDGRELFYLDDAGRIVAVPFAPSDPPQIGTDALLFQGGLEEAADRQFDVTADGQRFLLNRNFPTPGEPIRVVLGWRERLQQGPQR
ncbi:MAG: eukaryotic-like serine/threonine-protein kinase [Acidobacteriota bacterium]|nr:eukaryotic-like serine/threonine-protein kinase [Acidobacteriota bacterium]